MSHHVVEVDGKYQGPRRATGRLYENRTCLVSKISEARVFNTKGAATNSMKSAGLKGKVRAVSVEVI